MLAGTCQEIVEALAQASSVNEIKEICLRICTRIGLDHSERISISLLFDAAGESRPDAEGSHPVADCCDDKTDPFPASAGIRETGWSRDLAALPLAFHLSNQLRERMDRPLVSVPVSLYKTELSDREKDCLHWAAEGKTSWETAKILQISKRTVVFHLQNASKKLNASNRQNAIARAVVLGLITPQVS